MKSLRGKTRDRATRWWVLAGLAAAMVVPGVVQARGGALDLLYERTVMSAADSRCRLFHPRIAAALNASRIQARGAALRAGTSPETIAETERRARARAAGAACNSKDLTLAAGRVRTGFDGYSKLARMSYPGDIAGWNADRAVSRDAARWKLVQDSRFGWDSLRFGLAGFQGQGSLAAVVSFADGARPYAARLVMRDVRRTRGPYLDKRAGAGKMPLSARLPPRSASQVFSADARAVADPGLLPPGAKSGWTYRFALPATEALSGLDPREAVAVEFVFAGPRGDTVRRAYIEVGDFAAGRAFLDAGVR